MTDRIDSATHQPTERTGRDHDVRPSVFPSSRETRTPDNDASNPARNREAAASSAQAASRATAAGRSTDWENSSATAELGNRSSQPCAKALARNSSRTPWITIATAISSGRPISGRLPIDLGPLRFCTAVALVAEYLGAEISPADTGFSLPLNCIFRCHWPATILYVSDRRIGYAKQRPKLPLGQLVTCSINSERVFSHDATHRSIVSRQLQEVAHRAARLRRVAP